MRNGKPVEQNKFWNLVEFSKGCKQVFKTKGDSYDNLEHYKAIFVTKVFTQKNGDGYEETFSPASLKNSFKIIMTLVAHYDLKLHQMNVKITFLNGDFEENIYLTNQWGFQSEQRNT